MIKCQTMKRVLFIGICCGWACLFSAHADDAVVDPHPGSLTVPVTGTLPVMYINTVDNTVIDQKTTYIDATYWIETNGINGYEPVGSREEPLALGIRGRGNSSWGYDKKPYKIKLDKKTALFGLSKSKHWALLNHYAGQEALIENVSFELGRRMGLGWTPSEIPVEVVLNGHNIGLYYLTETVRIEPQRVNIYEQPDQNTDPQTVMGGWLIEIDNYDDPCQIQLEQDSEGVPFTGRFTYHSPEDLSELQYNWLENELKAITERIYTSDKTDNSWAELLDIESLARYYLVQELTDNIDAFIGSTYFYKDLEGKWIFGPMWDSGWTYDDENRQYTIFERRRQYFADIRFTWIEELLKFPYFREYTCNLWKSLSPGLLDGMDEYIDAFISHIASAYKRNYDEIWKWETYTIDYLQAVFTQRLHDNYDWMNRYVDNTLASIDEVGMDSEQMSVIKITQCGDRTIEIAGCNSDIVGVEITGLDGRNIMATMTSSNTATLDATAGFYIAKAFTSAGATLPAKFILR